jgi:hypothetical protein
MMTAAMDFMVGLRSPCRTRTGGHAEKIYFFQAQSDAFVSRLHVPGERIRRHPQAGCTGARTGSAAELHELFDMSC